MRSGGEKQGGVGRLDFLMPQLLSIFLKDSEALFALARTGRIECLEQSGDLEQPPWLM